MNNRKISILIFSWNTGGVRIADSLNIKDILEWNNNKYISYLTDCKIPDFFDELVKIIKKNDYDLVVIGFQEDVKPGSYFHSHFLPNEMIKYGYKFLARNKLIGVGMTTYSAIFEASIKFRGLRLSIYVKNNLYYPIMEETKKFEVINGSMTKSFVINPITRAKGAVALYISIPTIGTIAFINEHLPFESKSLIDSMLKQNYMLRQNSVNYQNNSFNNIYENLILNLNKLPDYVIVMGDLNYRTKNTKEVPYDNQEMTKEEVLHYFYQNYDELYDQMNKNNIYQLDEGVDNTGPLFEPTAKLNRGRTPDEKYYKRGKYNQRIPSWCDRILYKQLNTNNNQTLKCELYQLFDHGKTMAGSDHAGVVAAFSIEKLGNSILPNL